MPDQVINPQQPSPGNPGTAGGQTQDDSQHQGVFGGSEDIFNNPDLVKPVEEKATIPKDSPKGDDFDIHLDDLKIAQNTPKTEVTSAEPTPEPKPEIIEPTPKPEPVPEAPAKPDIIEQTAETKKIPTPKPQIPTPKPTPSPAPKPETPKPQIPTPKTDSVVEPQMKAGAKVNPRGQGKANNDPARAGLQGEQGTAPKPQAVKPQVKEEKPKTESQKPQIEPKLATEESPEEVGKAKAEVKEEKIGSTSDLKKKLDELVVVAKNLYDLEKKDGDDLLEILGADNDKLSVLYQFSIDKGNISIKKTETDKVTEAENIDDLAFVYDEDNKSVQILLDDVLLFDEIEHLTDNMKKKMQVTEKLNKFIFLLGEQVKKLEKESKEKEAEDTERRRLQDIFRNF